MKLSFVTNRSAVALTTLIFLSGCGSLFNTDKVNYKTEGGTKVVPLDVPPDLTQLTRDTRYAVPSGSVTANSMGARPAASAPSTAAKQLNDVRVEREGNQRWLVVNRPAEVVWPIVHSFWKENGFEYVIDQQQLGLLETEWAENRAKIPQDFIRRTLGKVLEGLYSSGERDKFRTRIERNNTGGVDIYVTHRGMIEEFKDQTKVGTIWVPRPRDTELEAEFIGRLLVKLGVSTEQAKPMQTAGQTPSNKPSLTLKQNGTALVMPSSFDVSWRRVGLALDRNGFTVEDRDRAQGLYFVRYVDSAVKEEKGFFSKLFSSSTPETGPVKYRIWLQSVNGATEVSVQNASGQTETSPVVQRIVQLLADDLR